MEVAASLREELHQAGYITDEDLATVLWLATALQRPLLIEGDAGVGKTALAIALAASQGRRLVRLQCHEGIDLGQAAYEWNYGKQLLSIRVNEHAQGFQTATDLFSRDFLLERPLLQAISSTQATVLLVDEVDRADEAFEAFLLEVLADYQITVPELGTIRATHVPLVILTSNGTRELSDALRRRCLYHWLDYPSLHREIDIVRHTLPSAESMLIEQAVVFVQRLRREDLIKTPGIAETLDWVRALHRLRLQSLPDDPHGIMPLLGCLLKTKEDRFQFNAERVLQLIEGKKAHQAGVAAAMNPASNQAQAA
ncbi:MAG: MoxR family ATPase [Betaproteobacteria bacterium]|jgi:MoxR-like ATPase|nr:MoxR family ATPase [Pseudomonadota bacterium]NBO03814.1 MoxR family ATPase [Betaproteobacteria bacterium]HAB48753.1 ATPase [Lautropia sp.]NBP35390.1 MoxR family ATPase [Betaproteobacteria bacterium]NBQ79083.1 MoxR family ATPase [Betaproteobacteria bacterium]